MRMMSEEQRMKKGKMLMMMPVVVVPFLTLVFWALGGGPGGAAPAGARSAEAGINTELPGARIKEDKSLDKMGFYELAEQDSLKKKEAIANDPYYSKLILRDTAGKGLMVEQDENERKVYEKLDELNQELEKGSRKEIANDKPSSLFTTTYNNPAPDVNRLEQLLAASREKDSTVDPETHALNNMLERILDIQHPERVREKLQHASQENKGLVLPVYTVPPENIHALEPGDFTDGNSFLPVAIPCELVESRTLYEGAAVKMRLLSDVFIMGNLIPRNTFVSGIASFDNARLQIRVAGIYFQHHIFPVQLSAYDLEGIKGLELKANIQHELMRQSGDRGVQQMNIGSLDPSIAAQAATAGIEVAKNVMSKKLRRVTVPVKAGEQVLLISDERPE